MNPLVLIWVALAAAPAGLGVRLQSSGAAAGVGLSLRPLERLEVTGDLARPFALDTATPHWAWAVGARSWLELSSVELGVKASAGSTVEAVAYGRYAPGAGRLHVEAGYRHGGAAVAADASQALLLGQGFIASARLEAPLGVLVPFASARMAMALPGSAVNGALAPWGKGSAEGPQSPSAGGASGEEGADLASCDPRVSRGFLPSSGSSGSSLLVVPGVGVRVPFAKRGALSAQAEWAPTGLMWTAGAGFSFDLTRARPSRQQAAPAAVEKTGRVEVRLVSREGRIAGGHVQLRGARTYTLSTPSEGVASLELEPGEYVVTYRAAGHLAREALLHVRAGERQTLEVALARTPSRRSVMRTAQGIRLFRKIAFVPGTAVLLAESQELIDELADVLVDEPSRGVRVAVHLDRDETVDTDALSQEQADVLAHLLGQRVVPSRVQVAAVGAREPVIPNLTGPARDLNRRVELQLTDAAAGYVSRR